MPKLTAPQMRALRLLNTHDVYTPADLKREAAFPLPTALALQAAGYASVERLGLHYGDWKATITQAGRDKLDPPPPDKPGISYANFLITGPDGRAVNSENGAQALSALAFYLRDCADEARRRREQDFSDELTAASDRILGIDPDHTRWPVRLRFQAPGFRFLEFAAERCQDITGSGLDPTTS